MDVILVLVVFVSICYVEIKSEIFNCYYIVGIIIECIWIVYIIELLWICINCVYE